MTAAKLDPEVCRRLAAKCAEEDARMTPSPWEVGEDAVESAATLRARPCIRGHASQDPVDVIVPFGRAYSDACGIARTRNNLPAIAVQLLAAADLAESKPLTEQQVREVVRDAIDAELASSGYRGASGASRSVVRDAIATRVAKVLAGSVATTDDTLEAIRRRITRLTLAAGLPREVWSELCHIDTALSQLLAVADRRALDALPPKQRDELNQLAAGVPVPSVPLDTVVLSIPADLAESVAIAIESHAAWLRRDTGHAPEGIASLRADADRLDAVAEDIWQQAERTEDEPDASIEVRP